MWKIVDCRGIKHFYDNKGSFHRFWKHHHKHWQQCRSRYGPGSDCYDPMVGYMLVCVNGNLTWEKIRETKTT